MPYPNDPVSYPLPPGTTLPPTQQQPTNPPQSNDPGFSPPAPQPQQSYLQQYGGGLMGGGGYGSYGGGGYTDINPETREVGDDELASYRLNDILAAGGPAMRAAAARGRAAAARQGLMASGLAEGYAQRALIEGATPLALSEADTYGRTASENMAAINQSRLADASNRTSLSTARIGANASVASARISAEGQWRRALLEADLTQQGWDRQSIEAALDRDWRTEQAEMEREFGREQRGWQVEDRDLGREWSVEDRDFNYGAQREFNWWNYNANREAYYNNTIADIYSNPNLSAEQQEAAIRNFNQFWNQSMQNFNNYLPNPPPPIFGTPNQGAPRPPMRPRG